MDPRDELEGLLQGLVQLREHLRAFRKRRGFDQVTELGTLREHVQTLLARIDSVSPYVYDVTTDLARDRTSEKMHSILAGPNATPYSLLWMAELETVKPYGIGHRELKSMSLEYRKNKYGEMNVADPMSDAKSFNLLGRRLLTYIANVAKIPKNGERMQRVAKADEQLRAFIVLCANVNLAAPQNFALSYSLSITPLKQLA